MNRRFLSLVLIGTTLPLMAALCCYPREQDFAAPSLDRTTLVHSWQLERATCFCTALCPPDSANRPFTLQLLADGRYQRTGPAQAVEAGTWDLSGSSTLVLTSQSRRQEFVLDLLQNPGGSLIGDSLRMSTNSPTDCRNLVFSKLP